MGRKQAKQSVADLQELAKDASCEVQPPTVAEVEPRIIPLSAIAYCSIIRLWS
jgi:hypothetical protein